jgi:hypothetical protein
LYIRGAISAPVKHKKGMVIRYQKTLEINNTFFNKEG